MKVLLMNKISKAGLSVFDASYTCAEGLTDADAILVRSAKLHETSFDRSVLCVARAGAGVNNIPLDRCAKEGIVVFNTPGANANAVKELALAGMLLSARDIVGGIAYARTLVGCADAMPQVEANKGTFAGSELMGKTLLVIGLGAIGGPLANLAIALGMDVIGFDPYMSVNAAWQLKSSIRHATDLESALAEADYVSIHVPLTKDTMSFIGEKEVAAMKTGAHLMNFSRGEIVDAQALADGLNTGKIGKYVTDFPDGELLRLPNVIAIPHLGASTEESEDNCARMAAMQTRDYLERGIIRNAVNFPDCDNGPITSTARLLVLHANIPSMVAQISQVLSGAKINIDSMNNRSKGDRAVSVLDLEELPPDEVLAAIEKIDGVIRVRSIKKN